MIESGGKEKKPKNLKNLKKPKKLKKPECIKEVAGWEDRQSQGLSE
jgi:hypothetical protein